MPIGVLIALFLSEYAGRRGSRTVQLLMDVMNGLPSIIIAVFIYILIVAPTKQQSGFAAAHRAVDHRGAADRARHPGGAATSSPAPSAKPPTRSASPVGAAC